LFRTGECGHSKQWLFKKEFDSLKYQLKKNGGKYTEQELRIEAQKNIEEALIRFWREAKND